MRRQRTKERGSDRASAYQGTWVECASVPPRGALPRWCFPTHPCKQHTALWPSKIKTSLAVRSCSFTLLSSC